MIRLARNLAAAAVSAVAVRILAALEVHEQSMNDELGERVQMRQELLTAQIDGVMEYLDPLDTDIDFELWKREYLLRGLDK